MRDLEYDFAAFVRAWRDKRRYDDKHPDLATYFNARYSAFAAAFGADLEVVPDETPAMPDWMEDVFSEIPSDRVAAHRRGWQSGVHRMVMNTEATFRYFEGPLDGYLEMPAAIVALRRHYGPSLGVAVRDLEQAISTFILEVLALLFPEAATRTITSADLLRCGFDPADEGPDPILYY